MDHCAKLYMHKNVVNSIDFLVAHNHTWITQQVLLNCGKGDTIQILCFDYLYISRLIFEHNFLFTSIPTPSLWSRAPCRMRVDNFSLVYIIYRFQNLRNIFNITSPAGEGGGGGLFFLSLICIIPNHLGRRTLLSGDNPKYE